MLKSKVYWKNIGIVAVILSVMLIGISLTSHLYPFGNNLWIRADSYTQYSIFYKALRQMLLEHQSVLYSFKLGLGGNFFSIIAYYLASPLSLFVIFFPKDQILLFMTLLIYVKIILAGITFYSYLFNRQGHQIRNIMFACLYAMMSYNLIYAFNIMWLDAIIMLPVVLIFIDYLIEYQTIRRLVGSLTVLFIANFYSAYIAGIGIFIYFVAMLLISQKGQDIRISLKFIYAVIISAGLSMWIILPTYFGLKTGPQNKLAIASLWQRKTSLWDALANLYAGNAKLFSGAVIYAGMLLLILFGVFFLSKKVAIKLKIITGVISVIFLGSYLFEYPYVAWHGFQQPTGFGFRFGFLISLLLILVANYVLPLIEKQDLKWILLTSGGLLLLLCLLKYKAVIDVKMMLINVLLLLISSVGFLVLIKKEKHHGNLLQIVLLGIALFDIGVNAVIINQQFNQTPGYTTSADGWRTEDSSAVRQDLTYLKQDQQFNRVVMQPNNLLNQGLAYNFNGMSWFNTFGYQETARFLNQMGYSTSLGNKSLAYQNGNTIIDTFLGLKYRMLPRNDENTNLGYQKVKEAGQYTIYRNQNSLPLGWINDTKLTPTKQLTGNTFANQALLLEGEKQPILTPIMGQLTGAHNIKVNQEDGNTHLTPTDSNAYVIYSVMLPKKSELNVRLTSMDGANSYGKMDLKTDQIMVKNFPNYHNEGNLSIYNNQGNARRVAVKFLVRESVNFVAQPQFYSTNRVLFEKHIEKVKKVNLKVAKGNDGLISGKVYLKKKAPLFISVPYDASWRASVNQKSVKVIDNHGFSQVNLSSGVNIIQLRFEPKGLKLGVILTLATIIWISFSFIGKKYVIEKKY